MLNSNASSFCPPPTQLADWALNEFGHAELGDDRRTDRLLMIATAFTQQPTAPIPQACGPGPATQGAYRFFENDDVEPGAIRDAHQQATLQRLRHHCVVLALQDTSTLDYSTHPPTQGLGPIGTRRQKTIGLLLHSTLAGPASAQRSDGDVAAVLQQETKMKNVHNDKPGGEGGQSTGAEKLPIRFFQQFSI